MRAKPLVRESLDKWDWLHSSPYLQNEKVLRRLRSLLWLLAVGLGALHAGAAASRHSMNADGICYLDMGDAFLRGDWKMAINPVWSPLYSWILGFALFIIKPAARWEFPVVHLVNFILYCCTLVCFGFFWRELMRSIKATALDGSDRSTVALPNWALLALGYLLFTWSSLGLIEVWAVTPDMCVAALVYLASGFIVRIRAGVATYRTYALLGLVLGLAYLAKAVMFPLSFVFLVACFLASNNWRRTVPKVSIALAVFLVVAGPFVVALSKSKGRLTFGETGKLTYAWFVNGIPYPHWQGGSPGGGGPKHTTRKILDFPAAYEFGQPIGGTYAVAYDPSYWYEGVVAHFESKGQIKVLLRSALFFLDLFSRTQGGLVLGAFILCLMGVKEKDGMKGVAERYSLLIPATAAMCLYSLVYVESRYIGAFVVLWWADILSAIRLPSSPEMKRLLASASVGMLLATAVGIGTFNLEGLNALAFKSAAGESMQGRGASRPWQVAEGLRKMGLRPGDGVAVLGYSFDAYWARLARVRIIAELYPWGAEEFWQADLLARSRVIDAFARTGAKAIVSEEVPNMFPESGWERVNNTSYAVYFLSRQPQRPL